MIVPSRSTFGSISSIRSQTVSTSPALAASDALVGEIRHVAG